MKRHTRQALQQLGSDIGAIRKSEQTRPGGLTCDDFAFLLVAGPRTSELPQKVARMIGEHMNKCGFHRRPGSIGGLASTMVTPEMETEALRFVQELVER